MSRFLRLLTLALPLLVDPVRADPRREQGTLSPVAAEALQEAARLRAERDLPAALTAASK